MKIRFVLLVAALSFACTSAYAQKYEGVVDKTIAVVGNEAILLSELEAEIYGLMANGEPVDRHTRCDVLETVLENKLYLMQARIDSLTYSADMVEMSVNQRVDFMLARLGGQKELEEYFKRPLYKIKDEWRALYKDLSLVEQMRSQIQSDIPQLTPRDVKDFVDSTPEEDLPIVPDQYQISQIVVYPDKENAALATKERLLELRERVMDGESFSTLARLYSQDPESARKGGELGMSPKTIFVPEFSDAAMSLKEGQVSQIVETPYGFHLIQMIEKDGDMFNVRHILLRPEYTSDDRNKAYAKLDSIKNEVLSGTLTFEMAAKANSEDIKSRTNGGQMVNETTGSAYFDKDRLNPVDYNALKDLKVGGISEPFQSVSGEEEADVVYKIIRLDNFIPSHTATFEQDYDLLLTRATEKEASKAVDDFIKGKIASTYIVIDPMFRECDFEYDGWFKD